MKKAHLKTDEQLQGVFLRSLAQVLPYVKLLLTALRTGHVLCCKAGRELVGSPKRELLRLFVAEPFEEPARRLPFQGAGWSQEAQGPAS